jgi:hypothetical protein
MASNKRSTAASTTVSSSVRSGVTTAGSIEQDSVSAADKRI